MMQPVQPGQGALARAVRDLQNKLATWNPIATGLQLANNAWAQARNATNDAWVNLIRLAADGWAEIGVNLRAADLRTRRAATTGVLYFGDGDAYLYFDGTNFYLNGGGSLYLNGGARVLMESGAFRAHRHPYGNDRHMEFYSGVLGPSSTVNIGWANPFGSTPTFVIRGNNLGMDAISSTGCSLHNYAGGWNEAYTFWVEGAD